MAKPCLLTYKAYKNFKVLSNSSNLLIAHGLLGSKQNWAGISKSLSERLKIPVIPVDLRNHGDSPHSDIMNYKLMAEDMMFLINNEKLQDTILMGHSMGGKVVMSTALLNPSVVKKLIVVDVSPVPSKSTGEFANFLSSMANAKFNNADPSLASVRQATDKHLQAAIPIPEIRNFILANLISSDTGYKWRVNVPGLLNCLSDIFEFPEFDTVYDRPTLFIAGENSNYIQEEDVQTIKRLFPNSSVVRVSRAGHWVHADNPSEFIKIVTDFILTS